LLAVAIIVGRIAISSWQVLYLPYSCRQQILRPTRLARRLKRIIKIARTDKNLIQLGMKNDNEKGFRIMFIDNLDNA